MTTSTGKKMMHHNSKEFHDELLSGISPQNEYRRQLDTAVRGVLEFGGSPETVSRLYQVKLEDVVRAIGRSPNVVPGSGQPKPT